MNRKRRICIVCDTLKGGGAERVVAVLGGSLSHNNEVQIVTLYPSDKEYEVAGDVQRTVLFCKNGRILKYISGLQKIIQFIRRNQADVFIAFGVFPSILLGIGKYLFPQIHIILTERNAPEQAPLNIIPGMLRKRFYRYADAFVFQTEEARDWYSHEIKNKGVIIPNPISDYLPEKVSYEAKGKIVSVGRTVPQKNYLLLIDAMENIFKSYPNYVLEIYGEGCDLPKLKELVKKRGMDNYIFFRGFCTDVHQKMVNADFFVMSSDYEGMPNSLMEAMAMGLPVISTDCPVGGPRSLINHMNNGILIPVKSRGSLEDAIRKLIQNQPLREQFGINARKIGLKYASSRIAFRWEQLIDKII